MNKRPIHILIADDHQLVREGIKSSFDGYPFLKVVGEAANGKEVLMQLLKYTVDIVLMDIGMEPMDGIETTRELRKLYPKIKVLAVTRHDDDSHIIRMLRAGAMGYVLKTSTTKVLIEAIKRLYKGETYFSERVTNIMLDHYIVTNRKSTHSGVKLLTKREIEILKLISDGWTNQEIAVRLFISHRTVDTHRRNLIQKLHAKNTAGLVRSAIKNGIVEV